MENKEQPQSVRDAGLLLVTFHGFVIAALIFTLISSTLMKIDLLKSHGIDSYGIANFLASIVGVVAGIGIRKGSNPARWLYLLAIPLNLVWNLISPLVEKGSHHINIFIIISLLVYIIAAVNLLGVAARGYFGREGG